VAVYKTFKNDYITRCVTDPIEESCRVVREIDENTKAVLVIHEFGFPCKEIMSIKDQCKKKNIPLIEDCAWAYGTAIDDHVNIGDVGDYAIYSLPKILPMQYGGVLKGLEIDDETNWNEFQTLDYFKREIILNQLAQYLPELSSYNKKRQENWRYLQKLFKQDGFEAFGDLEQKTYPGSFVIKTNEVQDLFRRYEDFSVETGRYYPEDALYLPVHQNLETNQLNYLYGIFRGKLNLSSNYRRDGKRR